MQAAREYSHGYSRGYYAGSCCRWPEHRPPVPPNSIVAALVTALRDLRDSADNMCATLDPDDDFVKELGPKIDTADQAMIAVGAWLKNRSDSVTEDS